MGCERSLCIGLQALAAGFKSVMVHHGCCSGRGCGGGGWEGVIPDKDVGINGISGNWASGETKESGGSRAEAAGWNLVGSLLSDHNPVTEGGRDKHSGRDRGSKEVTVHHDTNENERA